MQIQSKCVQMVLLVSVALMLLIGCKKKTDAPPEDPTAESAIVSSPRDLIKRQGYENLGFFYDSAFEAIRCNTSTRVTHGNLFVYCNTTVIDINSWEVAGELNLPATREVPYLYFNKSEGILYIFLQNKLYTFNEEKQVLKCEEDYAYLKQIIYENEEYIVDYSHVLFACKNYIITSSSVNKLGRCLIRSAGSDYVIIDNSLYHYYSLNTELPIFGVPIEIGDSDRLFQTRILDLTQDKVEPTVMDGLVFFDTSRKYFLTITPENGNFKNEEFYLIQSLTKAGDTQPIYTHRIAYYSYRELDDYNCSWLDLINAVRVFETGSVIINIGKRISKIDKNGSVTSVFDYKRCHDIISESIIVTFESGYLCCRNIETLEKKFAQRYPGEELDLEKREDIYWYRSQKIQVASDPRLDHYYIYDDENIYCYRKGSRFPYSKIRISAKVEKMIYSWTKQCLVIDIIGDYYGRCLAYVDTAMINELEQDVIEAGNHLRQHPAVKYEYIGYEDDRAIIMNEKIACEYDNRYALGDVPHEMIGCRLLYYDDKMIACEKDTPHCFTLCLYYRETKTIKDIVFDGAFLHVSKENVYIIGSNGVKIYNHSGVFLRKHEVIGQMHYWLIEMTDKYIYCVEYDQDSTFDKVYIYNRMKDCMNMVEIQDDIRIHRHWNFYLSAGLVAVAKRFHGRPIVIVSSFSRCDDPVIKEQMRAISNLK